MRERTHDHRSGPTIRKAHSISRINFSRSTPALPTHNTETGNYDESGTMDEESVTTRPRSATEDGIEFSSSEAHTVDFSSSEQFADDEDDEDDDDDEE